MDPSQRRYVAPMGSCTHNEGCKEVVGIKQVRGEFWVPGHFPDVPLLRRADDRGGGAVDVLDVQLPAGILAGGLPADQRVRVPEQCDRGR